MKKGRGSRDEVREPVPCSEHRNSAPCIRGRVLTPQGARNAQSRQSSICNLQSALVLGRRGSALTLALIFGVLAFSAAMLYLSGQTALARIALHRPGDLQVRLNARSAVYWGLDYLRDSTSTDTLRTVSTLDTMFGMGLFKDKDDSGGISLSSSLLPLDGTPYSIPLFDSLGLGEAEVARELAGATVILRGRGVRGEIEKYVVAELGSRWEYSPDTLLYLPEGYAVTNFSWAIGRSEPAAVRMEELQEYLATYTSELRDTSLMPAVTIDQPAIMDNAALSRIPDEVEGSLLLDGSFTRLRWHADRRVVVHGDLQLTGEVSLRGLQLLVEHEIRLLDECTLEDVDLVAGKRIFMAGTCSFSGSALSLDRVVMQERATVKDRSVIVAAAGGARASTPTGGRPPNAGAVSDSLTYTLAALDQVTVDGTLVALGTPGSIRIDNGVQVRGILYADGRLCMNGLLVGVARAKELVDCRDAKSIVTNALGGEIQMAPKLTEYRLPSYMGRQIVLEWTEETKPPESGAADAFSF